MKRLLIVTAVSAAALAITTPAIAGLAGNPSFSHRLPVRVPDQAQVISFDDRGQHPEPADDRGRHSAAVSSPAASVNPSRSAEPGDDRGSATTEPGDDRGLATTEPSDDRGSATTEPGDDRGSATTEPGDDRGSATTEPGDDRGGSPAPTTTSPAGDDHGGSDAGRGGDDHGGGK